MEKLTFKELTRNILK